MEVLSDLDRLDPLWIRIEEYLQKRRDVFMKKLLNSTDEKESDRYRGHIKELSFLVSPPAITPTAKVDPRVSADQEGFHVR